MGLDIIKRRVNREIEKGWIGPDRSCEYYPCHYDGMDCTFCYCPFFPCKDPRYGRYVESPNPEATRMASTASSPEMTVSDGTGTPSIM